MNLNEVIAVIDCGTNTFNLLITKATEGAKLQKLYSDRIAVRLGENGINSGFIAQTAYNRGISALAQFSEIIATHSATTVIALATSAIRDASNGNTFVQEVKQKFNINLQIIDGNREAELIYYGNKAALDLGSETALIMDIGGGSNEFILCNNTQIFWKQSFRVGAARLLELFPHQNPITSKEIETINDYLNQQLFDLLQAAKKFPPLQLVGSSGAFDSIIEMIAAELNGEAFSSDKTGYDVNMQNYQTIANLVIASNLEQRKKIKGLVPMRVDMMVISCLMINHILTSLQLKKLKVSTYSLKEGALYQYIQSHTK